MKTLALPLTLLALGLLVLAGVLFTQQTNTAQGSAFTGQPAYLQIATTTAVGPDTKKQLFAENGYCRARVITTHASNLFLLFGDPGNGDLSSTTLSGTTGHLQLASTTVAYDSGIYGCGKWWSLAQASTSVTLSEL